MKLIEVVVLLGAQCISPVQHTGTATEAAKVQCAVVIEKDTEAGTLRIVPAGASREPEVVAVLERLDGNSPAAEPAAAPPAQPAPGVAPPPQLAVAEPEPPAAPETPAIEEEPPAETAKTAKPKETRKAEAKAKPKIAPSQESKQASKSRCIGEAKPKWYTNAEGRRKYRCVLPG